MPNRLIHEQARFSPTLAKLTDFGERLFWRLTITADDFGRFAAAPAVVRAFCFPVQLATVTEERIAQALDELAQAEVISLYEVRGARIGAFTTWDRYQRRRARKSKFPSPDDRDPRANGAQLARDSRATRGVDPNPNPKSNSNPKSEFAKPQTSDKPGAIRDLLAEVRKRITSAEDQPVRIGMLLKGEG